jgi:hypothetical protein
VNSSQAGDARNPRERRLEVRGGDRRYHGNSLDDVQAGWRKVPGTVHGHLGELPVTATIKRNAVEFAVDATIQGTAVHIAYSGTVAKDSMKGTVKLGDLGDATFTAKKKP